MAGGPKYPQSLHMMLEVPSSYTNIGPLPLFLGVGESGGLASIVTTQGVQSSDILIEVYQFLTDLLVGYLGRVM